MGYKQSLKVWSVLTLGIAASVALLSGCGSEETIATARIPSITVQCKADAPTNCEGHHVYVYWTTGECSVSSLGAFAARSFTVVNSDDCVGGVDCEFEVPSENVAVAQPWLGMNERVVTTLPAGSYRACAVVNSNGTLEADGKPNVGDAGDYIGGSDLIILNATTASPTVSVTEAI